MISDVRLSDIARRKGWKLSTQDTGTTDPKYDEITTFILTDTDQPEEDCL